MHIITDNSDALKIHVALNNGIATSGLKQEKQANKEIVYSEVQHLHQSKIILIEVLIYLVTVGNTVHIGFGNSRLIECECL